jgi:parallel beta-helix repeat protein
MYIFFVKKIPCIVFFLGFLVASVVFPRILVKQAYAATYYVDSIAGLNTNNGTSSSTPWQTIAKVNSSTFSPGDNILFKAGDTWREELMPPSSGASGTPITFGSYGSGVQPVIDGLNVVASSSWTSTTTSISGSVTQANMRISAATGTAFVDFSAANALTPYIGNQITISDSTGHHLIGYIKAAGTGETYGSQLLTDPAMDTLGSFALNNVTTTVLNNSSTCYSGGNGKCLQVTPTSAYGTAYQYLGTVTSGWLLRTSAYLKAGTETSFLGLALANASYTIITPTTYVLPMVWTQYILYATADSTASNFTQSYQGATVGKTSLFDTASIQQVLTPSTTGVTIVSTSGGSTYNWTSMASGFNLNDSDGYTYTISSGATVYYSSLSANPNQVFEDGTRLTAVGSQTAMMGGTFWFNASSSLIYVRTREDNNPNSHTIEVGVRPYAIFLNNVSNVVFNGITWHGGQYDGFKIYGGNPTGLSIANCVGEWNYDTGFDDDGSTMSNVANVSIVSSTFRDNGGSGIEWNLNNFSGWTITDNQIYANAQLTVDGSGNVFTSSSDQYYSGGIKGGVEQTGGAGTIVSNNLVYNNGVASSSEAQGAGIWMDTVSGATVEDNVSYGNYGPGIFLEKNVSSTAIYNILYNNALSAIAIGNDTYGQSSLQVAGGQGYNSTGNLIANNTVIGGWWGISNTDEEPSSSNDGDVNSNNIFRNNIAIGAVSHNLWTNWGGDNDGIQGSGNIYDHNAFGIAATGFVYWGTTGTISTYSALNTAYGSNMNNVQSNPLFTSSSTDNFTITSSSPSIDAGRNLGSTYEYGLDPASTWPANMITDNQNNFGSSWDIGAYIYTQTSTPSIAWLSPSASSTVSSTITLSASSTAVAPASISSVRFYLDGSPLGSAVTSSPYTINWNTGTATNASHTLYALATDNYSNTATSTSITVTVANQAVLSVPTSTLSFSAVHGSTATSTQSVIVKNAGATSTTLNWSASSSQSWLTFSPTSGSLAGNATTSISFIVNPATLALGTYNATTTVSDPAASSSPQAIPVTLTISSTGVSATITAPVDGTTLSGTASITASATSTAGIASLSLLIDGSPVASTTASSLSYPWDTTQASNSTHAISVLATDTYNNSASSSISVTVANAAPSATPSPVVEVAAGGGGGTGYTPAPVTTTSTPPAATSTTISSVSTSSLQAELNTLLAELQALETQAGITSSSSPYVFTRNLTIGSKGSDVETLQHYLNTRGFPVNSTPTYAGSLGYETQYFGKATQTALAEFQKSVGISPAVGFFGPITRAYVNAHE